MPETKAPDDEDKQLRTIEVSPYGDIAADIGEVIEAADLSYIEGVSTRDNGEAETTQLLPDPFAIHQAAKEALLEHRPEDVPEEGHFHVLDVEISVDNEGEDDIGVIVIEEHGEGGEQ